MRRKSSIYEYGCEHVGFLIESNSLEETLFSLHLFDIQQNNEKWLKNEFRFLPRR